MGNNYCKCQICDSNNNKLEKDLSRDFSSTPKTLSINNNFSFNFQKDYLSGINSSKHFQSSSIFKNNISPSNLSGQKKNSIKNNINKNENIINNKEKILNCSVYDDDNNKNENLKNKGELNKINDKQYNYLIINRNINNNICIYKRNNLLLSQSTKKINESDLNSIIRKSTIHEYK